MNTLADMNVGAVVYLRLDGDYAPFRVLHQGKPDSTYDDSYEGGTILCLDCSMGPYETQMVADTSDGKGTYAASYLHQVLNQNWLAMLDSAMQQMVMEVKLPYRTDVDGEPYEVASGSSGLAAKVWLPSAAEVTTQAYYEDQVYDGPYVEEGSLFDYWKDADEARFQLWACSDKYGFDIGWGTRTPTTYYHEDFNEAPFFMKIMADGEAREPVENAVCVWPCLVMPNTLTVDGDDHVHLLGSVPVKVSGAWKEGTAWSKQSGVWSEANAIAVKVSGVWKE